MAACVNGRDFQRSLKHFRIFPRIQCIHKQPKRLLSSSCIRCAPRLIRTDVIRLITVGVNITSQSTFLRTSSTRKKFVNEKQNSLSFVLASKAKYYVTTYLRSTETSFNGISSLHAALNTVRAGYKTTFTTGCRTFPFSCGCIQGMTNCFKYYNSHARHQGTRTICLCNRL